MDLYTTSVEYAYVTVEADRALDMDVEVCVLPFGDAPMPSTVWTTAEWQGSAGLKRDARFLLAGPYADEGDLPAVYIQLSPTAHECWVYLRLTDNPEVIIRGAGSVVLKR